MVNPENIIPVQYQTTIDNLVQQVLAEDLGTGDVTSLGTISESATGSGQFISKANGVIAGLAVAARIFREIDTAVSLIPLVSDGERVKNSQKIARINGPVRALLAGERTALNILQRMSGIATRTRELTGLIAGTNCRLLDTRKTAPGLRVLDKWAVAIGGGTNHRSGLFDMILIKDNHIQAAGGITAAVSSIWNYLAQKKIAMVIEVEVQSITELQEALTLSVDRIMLDNMSHDQMRTAVKLAGGKIPLEASGNITGENIAEIAATGVDFISVGALTHSVTALDISFIINK